MIFAHIYIQRNVQLLSESTSKLASLPIVINVDTSQEFDKFDNNNNNNIDNIYQQATLSKFDQSSINLKIENNNRLISLNWKKSTFVWYLIYCLISSICILGQSIDIQLSPILWSVAFLFGLTIVVLTTKQTKEVLGCVRESQIILVGMIVITLLQHVPGVDDDVSNWYIVVALFLTLFIPFVTLFVPLFIIWKNKKSNKKILTNKKTRYLRQYLNGSQENYNKFKQFLAQCFAVENLYFFERVVIYKHVINKHYKIMNQQYASLSVNNINVKEKKTEKGLENKNESSMNINVGGNAYEMNENTKAINEFVLSIKFNYLNDTYQVYSKVISKDKNSNGIENKAEKDKDKDKHKNKGIKLIAKSIYMQFIADTSTQQVTVLE